MSGSITGNVADTGGDPIEDALVTVIDTDNDTEEATTTTNSSGDYSVSLADDTYDIRAEKRGYLTDTVTGVTVSGGTTTAPDHSLLAATYKMRGELGEFGYGVVGKATGSSGDRSLVDTHDRASVDDLDGPPIPRHAEGDRNGRGARVTDCRRIVDTLRDTWREAAATAAQDGGASAAGTG